jgi:hypothetical protein
VPKDKWKVSGEAKEYASPGTSGKLVHRCAASGPSELATCSRQAQRLLLQLWLARRPLRATEPSRSESTADCGPAQPDAAPEIVAVKLGTLKKDQKKHFKPEADVWGVDILPWIPKTANFNEYMP